MDGDSERGAARDVGQWDRHRSGRDDGVRRLLVLGLLAGDGRLVVPAGDGRHAGRVVGGEPSGDRRERPHPPRRIGQRVTALRVGDGEQAGRQSL